MQALVSRIDGLADVHRDVTVVLGCSAGCRELCATGALRACHGQALAERYSQLRAARDAAAATEAAAARQRARQAAAAAPAARGAQQRAERPGADEAGAGTIGYVSLLRFRHGGARQVPDAVREAMLAGPAPWMRTAAGGVGGARGTTWACAEGAGAEAGASARSPAAADPRDGPGGGECSGSDGGGEHDAAGDAACTEAGGAGDGGDESAQRGGEDAGVACAEPGDQRVAEHVQRAGGDVDGRLGELLGAAAEGTAVVYEEQPPPTAGGSARRCPGRRARGCAAP